MSQFIEVKTAELTAQALDWAVSLVEGVEYIKDYIVTTERNLIGDLLSSSSTSNYRPSTNWAQGGPLVDKYHVDFSTQGVDEDASQSIEATVQDFESMECWTTEGDTRLQAMCRAIVVAKLGDVVQVPAELVETSK